MSSWYQKYPHSNRAVSLIDIELELTDIPPEDTQFSGMKMLIVAQKGSLKRWKVMVTEQDISKAVDLYIGEGCFTFRKEGKYATVTSYEKPKHERKET